MLTTSITCSHLTIYNIICCLRTIERLFSLTATEYTHYHRIIDHFTSIYHWFGNRMQFCHVKCMNVRLYETHIHILLCEISILIIQLYFVVSRINTVWYVGGRLQILRCRDISKILFLEITYQAQATLRRF